jgi:hypothetical protein
LLGQEGAGQHSAEKPTAEKPTAPSIKMPFEKYKENVMNMLVGQKESGFDWRIDKPEFSQKEREKGVADLKAGKDTAAARKIEQFIKDSYEKGDIPMLRGHGSQVQRHTFGHEEWFGPQGNEPLTDEHIKAAESIDDNAVDIINRDGITLENIDNLKHLFDGFPYDAKDLADVKEYLERQGKSSAEAGRTGEEGKKPESPAEKRQAIEDKYTRNFDDLIEDLKKEGRLEIKCPPGTKRRTSLKDLLKKKTA